MRNKIILKSTSKSVIINMEFFFFFLLGTKHCWKKLGKLWVPETWNRMNKVNNAVWLCLAETSHTAKHIICDLTVETSQKR